MIPSLSVVIPCYRSQESLPELLAELARALPEMATAYEVLLVNDGSPDGTWRVIREQVARHPFARGICLARNFGQHNALLCGIRASRHEVVVTMDDDLQHPPARIADLLAALTPDTDLVYGYPPEERHGWWRDCASVLTKTAMRLVADGTNVGRTSAFRAFHGRLREPLGRYQGPWVSIDVLLSWETTGVAHVPTPFAERRHGTSNYTVGKLVRHALNMITGYTVLPLRLASYLGFAATLFGIAVFVYVIINWLVRDSVPGFTFLAAAIAIFSGAQLFCLGLIGEYLARMYYRTLDRPAYTVRESIP